MCFVPPNLKTWLQAWFAPPHFKNVEITKTVRCCNIFIFTIIARHS